MNNNLLIYCKIFLRKYFFENGMKFFLFENFYNNNIKYNLIKFLLF